MFSHLADYNAAAERHTKAAAAAATPAERANHQSAASSCLTAARWLATAETAVKVANIHISDAIGPAAQTFHEMDFVDAGAACPECHERWMDALVWQSDDGETVACQACGKVYQPGTPAKTG